MEKKKIHYNKDGWVCERYPYDLPIENQDRYIEVDETTFIKTLGVDSYHAWKVKDGRLTVERYEETPKEELIEELRGLREELCFPIINRGQLWHDTLTPAQKKELAKWYADWLDATNTLKEPPLPRWLFNCDKNKKESDDGTNKNRPYRQ